MVPAIGERGTTVVELMVAVTVFLVLIGLLYPAFSFLQGRLAEINDGEVLSERGNRLLDYMAEKIRTAGFIIGSNPYITFCGETATNTLSHTEGDPYDTITFLTASPIETDAPGIPYLQITAAAARNDTSVQVNTSDISSSYIDPNGSKNAKALVTFDVLKPTYPYGINSWSGTVYTVAAKTGRRLVFADDPATPNVNENMLTQDINARSYVYAVRVSSFGVNANRELQETGWNRSCTNVGETFDLDETSGAANTLGGVDALQFEYVLSTSPGVFVSDIKADDLPNLRSVRISMLLRSTAATRYYKNDTSYQAGNLPPKSFNDSYKRILLTRVVDVRNMGLWRP